MLDLVGQAKAAATMALPTLSFMQSGTGFSVVVSNVLTWILILAGTLAVGFLVYGGILYITAGGDAEKATKGRTAVINAIIGIIIILLALVIVNWVMKIVKSGAA